uniref:Uncharacterized protein n=1 Tax=Vespula pensylvanica TaxID=30213 RepID=A0A834JJS0_VESPE|nr:hypothetical protein H0235_018252 [Vespula pensylvanica]
MEEIRFAYFTTIKNILQIFLLLFLRLLPRKNYIIFIPYNRTWHCIVSFSIDDSNVPLSEVITKRHRITRISSSEDFSPDSSNEIISFHRLSTRCNIILSSNENVEDESSMNNITTSHIDWSDSIGKQPWSFVGTSGFKILKQSYEKIEDIYLLLANDTFFEIVLEETN